MHVALIVKQNPQPYLSKYLPLLAGKCRSMYRQLHVKQHRQAHRQLNPELDLHCFYGGEANLDLNLCPALHLTLHAGKLVSEFAGKHRRMHTRKLTSWRLPLLNSKRDTSHHASLDSKLSASLLSSLAAKLHAKLASKLP